MKIGRATRRYEEWLREHCAVVAEDLETKHELMRRSVFSFFRGTFYRWMQLWPDVCVSLVEAPTVPAIGDLHVENFGTWRDREGRLTWGVNDFDECAPLPYTLDLVRLAASALVAIREARLRLSTGEACRAILRGYRRGLTLGGQPIVLEGRHHWLRHAATAARHPAGAYWDAMRRLPDVHRAFPPGVRKALRATVPHPDLALSFKHRVAGVGSLGRPRIVALAIWQGSFIAREAKAWVPSAALWVEGRGRQKNYSPETVERAVRAPDPLLTFERQWIIRRLAPDCGRIELADLARDRDERRLLDAMGWETANVHLGHPKTQRRVLRHLRRHKRTWLVRAAEDMVGALSADWRQWRARSAAKATR
jgi:hypothetical protein